VIFTVVLPRIQLPRSRLINLVKFGSGKCDD
jgi:hypothetical protein